MHINPAGPDWPREQAAAKLREGIQAGTIGPKLPTYRELSEMLGVAEKTVGQALKILQSEGLVYSKRGLGTFVTQRP